MFRAAAISGFKNSKFFQAVWGGVRNGQLRHPAEARRSVVGLRLTGKSQMCVANLAPLFGGAFSVGRCATNRQPAPLMRRACWSPSRNGNLCDGKHQVAGKPTLPLRRMARADLAGSPLVSQNRGLWQNPVGRTNHRHGRQLPGELDVGEAPVIGGRARKLNF